MAADCNEVKRQLAENAKHCNENAMQHELIISKVGDYVLIINIIVQSSHKLSSPTEGSYEITAVHTNGYVSIKLNN